MLKIQGIYPAFRIEVDVAQINLPQAVIPGSGLRNFLDITRFAVAGNCLKIIKLSNCLVVESRPDSCSFGSFTMSYLPRLVAYCLCLNGNILNRKVSYICCRKASARKTRSRRSES